MRRRYTAEERERLIAEVRAGETVRAVAARMSVTASSAYQWMKEASPGAAPVFARVVPAGAMTRPDLTIQVGRSTIRIERGFDAELLRSVIAALSDS